jgi:hypothetical protein
MSVHQLRTLQIQHLTLPLNSGSFVSIVRRYIQQKIIDLAYLKRLKIN